MEETTNTAGGSGIKYLISHAPHAWKGESVSRIMWLVIAALLFPTAAGIYYFGFNAIGVIIVSVLFAVGTEWVCKHMRGKPFIMDGSAVVTGLLLALIMPPTIPLWMVAVGAIFSIGIAKEVFGGLGYNVFNPALAGRAFMMVCFAQPLTTWVAPTFFGADAVTTATPLNENFIIPPEKAAFYWDLFIGNIGGSIGETSFLLCLLGGIVLLAFKIIDWHIPVAFFGAVMIVAFLFGQDPVVHLLSGGLALGAFFMATDYATSPLTMRGRLLFGAGCGILTVLIRQLGGMPEGVCFSILLMNSLTPLIDRHLQPKPFGSVKKA